MKNSSLKIIALLLFLNGSFLSAQEISGTAYYKVKTVTKDIKFQNNIDKDFKERIQKKYAEGVEEEFILDFTDNESVYKPKTIYENQMERKAGEIYTKNPEQYKLYRNVAAKQVLFETKLLGKYVVVKDSIINWNWKLENGTMKIGDYECKKATREYKPHQHKEDIGKNGKEIKPHVVTVWYAPEISVSHGPGIYYGLQGLILQVEDGNRTVKLTKLKRNKKPKEIKKPSNGKLIAKKDFNEISSQICNCD